MTMFPSDWETTGLTIARDIRTATEETARPFAVWIEGLAPGRVDSLDVCVRRPDGSVLTLIGGVPQADAQRIAQRVREAIGLDEPWILRLVDVSAGKLRG